MQAPTGSEDLRAEVTRLRAEITGWRGKITGLRTQLERRDREAAEAEVQLERYAADLRETFKEERARRRELEASYTATVRALSNAVEARDAYTSKHAERVTAYGMELARRMEFPLADSPELEFGFLLHDIGKLAIPDAILYKPGPLNDEERVLMARHPVIGAEIIESVEFLHGAREVVRHHHERWDGNGYPDGLLEAEIPLAARIFAVADVLDAVTTDRPYRPAWGMEEAYELIVVGSGKHFDPEVISVFKEIDVDGWREIGERVR